MGTGTSEFDGLGSAGRHDALPGGPALNPVGLRHGVAGSASASRVSPEQFDAGAGDSLGFNRVGAGAAAPHLSSHQISGDGCTCEAAAGRSNKAYAGYCDGVVPQLWGAAGVAPESAPSLLCWQPGLAHAGGVAGSATDPAGGVDKSGLGSHALSGMNGRVADTPPSAGQRGKCAVM